MTGFYIKDGKELLVLERSLIPGLDEILCGGFLSGGLYMILGPPGTGKTVMASQIIYRRAAQGTRALYVTVLGENHARMMLHMSPMRFFDTSLIPRQVTYISAYSELKDEGLKGLTTLIRREVLTNQATLLVIDGASAIYAKATDVFDAEQFTYELQTLASSTGCTMFLMTTAYTSLPSPEHTMVDGLIELRQPAFGARNERRILIQKSRGSRNIEGEHSYTITEDGIRVFPRLESLPPKTVHREPSLPLRISSGSPSFDVILGGGFPADSMTALVGPSGTGKTTLGLHFLSQSSADEPGLLFGCYEFPDLLRLRARRLGFDIERIERSGALEFIRNPIGEYTLDELAYQMLDAVRRNSVKRLMIDSVSLFHQAAVDQNRIVRFWSALSDELRALGVSTLYSLEMPEIAGEAIRIPENGIPSLAETMVMLRHVEIRSQLFRTISLIKVRVGDFDPTIREFKITDTGLVIGDRFEGIESVLSGLAREDQRDPALPRGDGSQTQRYRW